MRRYKKINQKQLKQIEEKEENKIMEKKQYKKVVLAYSGGLDTSIIIAWLKENYGC